jgi:hypothetical protein
MSFSEGPEMIAGFATGIDPRLSLDKPFLDFHDHLTFEANSHVAGIPGAPEQTRSGLAVLVLSRALSSENQAEIVAIITLLTA